MMLLNPIWLWGLLGLTIPVGIHLLSRKEGKTIRIGSIRFLTETATSKFSSIRLNEVALLAIRCLLIGLLIIFLAGLLIPSATDTPMKWVVVEKGLENVGPVKSLLDSLEKEKYKIRRLADNFPAFETDTATQPPDYYSLSEKLSRNKNINSIVLAYNSLPGFKGKRISLPDNITWISFDPLPERSASAESEIKDTLQIIIAYSKDFQYDKKITMAALNSLQSASIKFLITETDINSFKENKSTDWIIWLSETVPPSAKNLLRFHDQPAEDLIIQDTHNQWMLTERLTEQNAVREHFSIQLMTMLFDKLIRSDLARNDKRIVADELAWSKVNSAESDSTLQATSTPDKNLLLLIILTFLGERLFAFYRKQ